MPLHVNRNCTTFAGYVRTIRGILLEGWVAESLLEEAERYLNLLNRRQVPGGVGVAYKSQLWRITDSPTDF